MLTNRQLKLLQLLEKTDTYQSIDYLAKTIGVSKRTLYSDLKALQDSGIELLRKRGCGVAFGKNSQEEENKTFNNQTLDRRIEIMCSLLFKKERITLKELSEKYYVSQSSIKYDLQFIENILSKGNDFKILSDRQGTRIASTNLEKRIRLLLNFNQFVIENSQILGSLSSNGDVSILSKYYPKNLVAVCKNVFYTFLRENITRILDVYVESLLSLFIALVSQLCLGEHMEKKGRGIEKRQHAVYISSAVNLLQKSSSRLQFTYTNDDVEYLSQMLLNYRFEQVSLENIDESIVVNLIEQVSKALNMDLSADRQLFEQLEVHIPAMLYRLKLGTPVKNPFTEQIKLEYSITYNVLWIVMQDFSQEIGMNFNEDEIAFLTIYFQLSVERYGASRRILIVCQTGIITSELLIHRIKNSLPSFDQVEVASVTELTELDLSKYDLILTTVKLNLEVENVHFISPFIKNEELAPLLYQDSLLNSLHQFFYDKDKEGNFPIYHPFLRQQFSSKEELFETICNRLQIEGFITEEFVNSLIEREEAGTTEFPLGIAIPHGKPAFVTKTFVAFIKLKRKMKWQDYFVDTVFLIGISKKDMKEVRKIVSNIYRFINDEKLLKKLKNLQNEQEVIEVLYGKK